MTAVSNKADWLITWLAEFSPNSRRGQLGGELATLALCIQGIESENRQVILQHSFKGHSIVTSIYNLSTADEVVLHGMRRCEGELYKKSMVASQLNTINSKQFQFQSHFPIILPNHTF